jgi:hypothetical protein
MGYLTKVGFRKMEKLTTTFQTYKLLNLLAFIVILLAAYSYFLRDIFFFTMNSKVFTYIFIVPAISIFLIYTNRKSVFSKITSGFGIGSPVILIGLAIYFAAIYYRRFLPQNDFFSLLIASIALFVIGGFVILYGSTAFRLEALLFVWPVFLFVFSL